MTEPTHQVFFLRIIDIILDRIITKPDESIEKEVKKTSRSKLIIILLIVIVPIDYMFKVSENIMLGVKISNIELIGKALESKTLDSTVRANLVLDQEMVAKRKSWQSRFDGFVSFIPESINTQDAKENTNPFTTPNLLHILSSSWIFTLLGFLTTFSILIEKGGRLIDKVYFIVIILVFLLFSIFGISYLFALIPRFEKPLTNYILNALLNLLVVFLLYKAMERANKNGYFSKLNS